MTLTKTTVTMHTSAGEKLKVQAVPVTWILHRVPQAKPHYPSSKLVLPWTGASTISTQVPQDLQTLEFQCQFNSEADFVHFPVLEVIICNNNMGFHYVKFISKWENSNQHKHHLIGTLFQAQILKQFQAVQDCYIDRTDNILSARKLVYDGFYLILR